MKTRMVSQCGFSMVEVAVTVAVIGIAATIAIPSFKGVVPRYKFQSDVRTMTTDYNVARMQAISRNREYRMVISAPGDSYTIQEGDKSTLSSAWTVTNTKNLRDADIFTVESLPGNAIIFTPDGSLDERGESPGNGWGRVVLQGDQPALSSRLIFTANTGRVTVERWNGTSWVDERHLKE